MDVIPEVVRLPHFVRKIKKEETKMVRVNSLTSRKNKFEEYKGS
jgi:hypothetical protein